MKEKSLHLFAFVQHTFDVDSLVFAMPVGDAGMKPPRCTMALSRTLRWECFFNC